MFFVIDASSSGSTSPDFAHGRIDWAWPVPPSAKNVSGALPPWTRVAIVVP